MIRGISDIKCSIQIIQLYLQKRVKASVHTMSDETPLNTPVCNVSIVFGNPIECLCFFFYPPGITVCLC